MRILMLAPFYPPFIGGMERHVQALSRELVRRGHHVAVATLQHKGLSAFEDDQGVRVHRLTGWNRLLAPFYRDKERQFLPPLPDPGMMAGLRRVVEQERPDIVDACTWMLYSFIGLKAWSGAKLVVTLHDYSLVCPTMSYLHNGRTCTGPGYTKCMGCASSQFGVGKAALLTNGLKLSSSLHKYIDRYIAVSSAVRDACAVGTGQLLRSIEVVPPLVPAIAIDESDQIERPAFLPPEDDYILFVGRNHPYKGLNVLLDAYAELSDLAPLVVMIAGDGDAPKRIPSGVTVVRNVPHAQVMAGWKHCAVGVIPSIWPDACPTVAIEAMVYGKPVVASAVGGLCDMVVDGESGLLVPPGDASMLREALRTLLLDPTRRAQMGRAAYQHARLFMGSTVADRIERIYAELLTSGDKPQDHHISIQEPGREATSMVNASRTHEE